MRAIERPPQERPDTKDRILDVAERMFAQYGFDLTSLRSLTTEADVNLSAVNYHFGSKERLFEEVIQRLVGPVNDERLTLLDALEAQKTPPSLEALIEAFVGPPLRLYRADPHRSAVAPRLLGRTMGNADDEATALLLRLFGRVVDRYVAAFSRALPHVPPDEVLWRMFFMVGVMVQIMSCGHHLKFISAGRCDPTDPDETIQRVVAFAAAGLRAGQSRQEAHA